MGSHITEASKPNNVTNIKGVKIDSFVIISFKSVFRVLIFFIIGLCLKVFGVDNCTTKVFTMFCKDNLQALG